MISGGWGKDFVVIEGGQEVTLDGFFPNNSSCGTNNKNKVNDCKVNRYIGNRFSGNVNLFVISFPNLHMN
jgi:hypothetical protein